MDERTRARFESKVNKNGPVPPQRPDLGPCWLWTPDPGAGGYCKFYLDGRTQLAHRVAYVLFIGPIPSRYEVDHLCVVRNCVNPAHLEAVTKAENLRRGKVWEGGAAYQRNKTRCKCGEPFSGENLHVTPTGKRVCRTCNRRYSREAAARRRAANPPVHTRRKDRCRKGHAYAEHGYWDEKIQRHRCRTCMNDAQRARRAARYVPPPPLTHCKSGHEFTEANTYITSAGHKACRRCHNDRTNAAYHARKALAVDQ